MTPEQFVQRKIALEKKILELNVAVDFAWDLAINDGGYALKKAESERDKTVRIYQDLCNQYYNGKSEYQKSLGDFGKKRKNIKKKEKRKKSVKK